MRLNVAWLMRRAGRNPSVRERLPSVRTPSRLLLVSAAIGSLLLFDSVAATADEIEDFYKGKNVNFIVPVAPGGDYDATARLVSRYLQKYLPGAPTLIVQNMTGGRGIASVNYMYNVAPKDGSVIALMQRGMPQLAYVGTPGIKFDATQFTWLGTMSSYASDAFPVFIMANRPVTSWQEIRQGGKKVTLGTVGAGSTNFNFAMIAKDVLKLNIDVVRGYSGAANIYLAMQSGEVDGQAAGYASIKASQRTLLDNKQLRFLVQFGRRDRLPELADVPTGQELAQSDDDRALITFAEAPFFMAMPFMAPPAIPAARAAALRDALMRSLRDPEFDAEAKRMGFDISPRDGDAVRDLIVKLAETPPQVVARFKAITESQ